MAAAVAGAVRADQRRLCDQVPKASAVVPSAADGEPIAIHADPIHMVKLGTKSGFSYRTVSGHLRVMAVRVGDVIGRQWDTEGQVNAGT